MAGAGNIGLLALVALAPLIGLVSARSKIDKLSARVDQLRLPDVAAVDFVIEPFRGEKAKLMRDHFLKSPVRLDREFRHDVAPVMPRLSSVGTIETIIIENGTLRWLRQPQRSHRPRCSLSTVQDIDPYPVLSRRDRWTCLTLSFGLIRGISTRDP